MRKSVSKRERGVFSMSAAQTEPYLTAFASLPSKSTDCITVIELFSALLSCCLSPVSQLQSINQINESPYLSFLIQVPQSQSLNGFSICCVERSQRYRTNHEKR